ncbi:MAG: LacI family DNA-binding transcriptional regulator [Alkaliphilus sp.]
MPTIIDVAKLAGVSVGTASNVINDKGNVSQEKTKMVSNAIEELKFIPSESARILKRGKTNSIALLIPQISKPFYSMLIEGVESAASDNNYDLIFCKTNRDPKIEEKYLNLLGEKKVDGVILVSIEINDNALDIVEENNYPVVVFEKREKNLRIPNISIDNKKGAKKAVQYLLESGHKDIAFINGSTSTIPGMKRLQGYVEALSSYNLPFSKDLYFEDEYEVHVGYLGIKEILKKRKITAVFAGSDTIAIGVINGLHNMGFRVPEDISVIGFDDIYLASTSNPPLTTVKQPIFEMGYKAVEVLIDVINNKKDIKKDNVFETELIVRQSCKTLR